ncbi:glycoside hydrolase family 3 protein [Actinoplanes derwentensis]|uniref:beta-glucosidase n=1 Tax=Actinoplanes derwentensis TaxID=113562 RepID=A0A1H2DC02_9ACTN|nr:glycoside hydrolase family 3 N-terminal domain-containing protein [Actinoplanes derwentensis]GID90188.1 beta-glucosidase [Actinoplanes derwentensis]SDT80280.1 beta-glucosidase [Actinoplanes derwentensis]
MNARFPYEDPTLPVDQRVDDLLPRMSLEDKAGLLFQQFVMIGDLDAPGMFGSASIRELLAQGLTHFNILFAPSARQIAQWHNMLQDEARTHPLGIPVTIASDPRHHFTDNPATAMMAGPFTQFPEPLGLAALRDEGLVERFARLVRSEYRAVGIRAALHPQIDLATEPRWARQSTTFGEDAGLTARLGVAYIKGLQGDEVGPESVSVMAKHFPGGGPQKDGEDPHFSYGREQVYPGGYFDLHLEPFKAAIAAGVAQLMPYYGMPIGLAGVEEVGFGFNKDMITGLLREELGFDGIVCTDWGILSNTCWGVEHLTYEQRMLKALDAGVDQFGGEHRADVLVSLVRTGQVSQDRIDVSVRRLLREKFRLGLFDDRHVDAERADTIVGTTAARAEGIATQAAAHTLLTNAASGPARLPLRAGLKVYAEGLSAESFSGRATPVDALSEADVAVLRLQAPWEQRGDGKSFESFFHAGSLAFPAAEIERITQICRTVPTVIDIYLDRPAILTELAGSAAAVLANFGACEEAVVRTLFGEEEPRGMLPFDLPSSMTAVEASRPDAPFDTADPLFPFGHGLRYDDRSPQPIAAAAATESSPLPAH